MNKRGLLVAVLLLAAAPAPVLAQLAPVGAEFRVHALATNDQIDPSVAADGLGTFVVVWTSDGQDGSGYGVFGRVFDSAGAVLGAEFQVNVFTTGAQETPSVAVDGSGRFVVAWASQGQDGSSTGIFGRWFDSTGAPVGGEFQVNTYTTGFQSGPAVAVDGSGNVVATWGSNGQDGSGFGVFGRMFDSAGMPSSGEFQVNAYTTDLQSDSSIAVEGSGRFVVTWTGGGQDGNGFGVFGQRFDSAGMPLGGEFQVNTFTTNHQYHPSVAADADGAFVIAWTSVDQDGPGDFAVFGRRYDSTGMPVGGEFQVSATTMYSQSEASIVMDGADGFVVAWISDQVSNAGFDVFSRGFDGSGGPTGGERQINTYATADQTDPSVAVVGAGEYVVAWTSDGQDGSGGGVFARRYCADVDGDSLCNTRDVLLTSPLDGATLDCGNPRFDRPTFTWDPGDYDRFRVFLSSNDLFAKGTRVTSGDTLLKVATWTPSGKKWRNACNKAVAANSGSPVLFVGVLGVDSDLPKRDSFRKTFSQIVQADVLP